MTISDMLQTPEKYIPFGMYCYDHTLCPFWESRKGQYPFQEDGYCHLLDKSDWALNEEAETRIHIPYYKEDIFQGRMTIAELNEDEPDTFDPISGLKEHFPISLIWDQCKECGINYEDPEDIELVKIEVGEEEW